MGISRLVAVSKSLASFVQSRGLFRRKDIEIIYNGIDTSRYYRSVRGELRTKLSVEENTILVGSLGNIRSAKHYDLLIEAAFIVKQSQKDRPVHFLIAGHQHPDLMEKLTVLADARNVITNVHFLGFLDDTPAYLSELDIFLLCSSTEGFSIATIEAMAAGVPVIATRCGGPEEIVTDGLNGLLVENNNPIAIGDAISFLTNNKNRAVTLSDEAKKHVGSTFSIEMMSNRYRSIYEGLLNKFTTQS